MNGLKRAMGYRNDSGDPYVDRQSGVLTNLAGIQEWGVLEQFEAEMSMMRQIELAAASIPTDFDFPRLKDIHRYLFQDVYAWAGKPRTIDISKGSSRFGSHLHIETFLDRIFGQLARERLMWRKNLDRADLPARLAFYLGEINAAHPFRDGNGRTQRILIGQLAKVHGLSIRWETMSERDVVEASISSFTGDCGPLSLLLATHSVKIV